MPPVILKLDSPRKSYAQSPKMPWLYTFSEEKTCMKSHVSQFWPLDLKDIHKKLQSILFMKLLMKFESDAQRESYDDFPKVTYLKCNSWVCQKLTSLDHISENIAREDLKFRPTVQTAFFSNGFFSYILKLRSENVIAKIPRWPVLDEILELAKTLISSDHILLNIVTQDMKFGPEVYRDFVSNDLFC